MNGNSISIEILTRLNFKKWKEDFLFGMELTDVHIALTKDKPVDITTTSTEFEKTDYAAWERSNRICLLTMKKSIQEHLKSGLPVECTALKNDLEICVDCCRGKMTKIRKKTAVRSSDLLEVIHTDISGPYVATLCRNFYFITFIDDYSRYGYLYLI